MYHNNKWMLVSTGYSWADIYTKIICRQLGLPTYVFSINNFFFYKTSVIVVIDTAYQQCIFFLSLLKNFFIVKPLLGIDFVFDFRRTNYLILLTNRINQRFYSFIAFCQYFPNFVFQTFYVILKRIDFKLFV